MLEGAPWTPFVVELIGRLPIDEARRRGVAARFALACSRQALRACDRAGMPYPVQFDVCVRAVAEWLAEPSEARREAMREASLEVTFPWSWKDHFGSEHAYTMLRSVVGGGGLESATYGAARTAEAAARTIDGVARAIGVPPFPPRPQQVVYLREAITDALRAGWTPRDDAAAAWQGVDEMARGTWPRWLVELGRADDAAALEGCAAIVDAVTFRSALAVADARWPVLDAVHAERLVILRATSKRLADLVQYEDGNHETVDYAEYYADDRAAPSYAAAAAALGTGGTLDDAVDVLIDATRLAACVHATIGAVVADRAVAIATAANHDLTAEDVQFELHQQ